MDSIKLLTPKEIANDYSLPLSTVYSLLNIRGCPTITGGNNGKGRRTGRRYLVEKSAFDDWLRKKHEQSAV